jgi:hypothetical protein
MKENLKCRSFLLEILQEKLGGFTPGTSLTDEYLHIHPGPLKVGCGSRLWTNKSEQPPAQNPK